MATSKYRLHTELKSLIWALKCLIRHQRCCNHFLTDSQGLVKMVNTPEDWPVFATELCEFQTLWDTYQDSKVVYENRSNNTHVDSLVRHASTRKRVFSYLDTPVPY